MTGHQQQLLKDYLVTITKAIGDNVTGLPGLYEGWEQSRMVELDEIFPD